MLSTLTSSDGRTETTNNDFEIRHPLEKVRRIVEGHVVESEISVYHEAFNIDAQIKLANIEIPIGRISHLSDDEDNCPFLSTFKEAYGKAAIEWMISHLSFANYRVASVNPMTEEQLKICAIAIYNAFPYLNIAEIVRFFGMITTYYPAKESYVFGETQVMSALNTFCKERRVMLDLYDREQEKKKLEQRRAKWRDEGVTRKDWENSDEGKNAIEELMKTDKGRLALDYMRRTFKDDDISVFP